MNRSNDWLVVQVRNNTFRAFHVTFGGSWEVKYKVAKKGQDVNQLADRYAKTYTQTKKMKFFKVVNYD